jgi:hypothetical protein
VSAKASFPMCLLVVFVLLSSLPTPAQAFHFLGGADMGKYCRSIAGPDATAGLETQNAYGWICKDKNGQKLPFGVSVTQACRVTHNNPTAIDFLRDFYNPYSWDCYGNITELGGVDFAGYCKHLWYKKEIRVAGTTAYNLYCVTQSNQLVDVLENRSATKACQWTWANPDVIARLLNFNDPSPHAWQCWW